MGDPVGASERVEATVRARGWWLLSSLYLEGVTEDVLPALRAVPGLAALVDEPVEPEEAGASHHALFGVQVLPYASVFLERSGVLGGPVSESVARAFQRAEMPLPTGAESPDHLGHELALLGLLTERDDRPGAVELLAGHIVWWVPVFVHSALRHATGPWPAILRLTLDAAVDQAAALVGPDPGNGASRSAPEPPGALALPVEDPLGDVAAGLSTVATHLVTPARSGLYLALADLRALGRKADVPTGFGPRKQVMTHLLRSAAGYGSLGAVLEGLRALARAQADFLEVVPPAYRVPWTERLEGLGRVLDRLAMEGGSA